MKYFKQLKLNKATPLLIINSNRKLLKTFFQLRANFTVAPEFSPFPGNGSQNKW